MEGKLNSELLKQLDHATGSVQAVIQFHTTNPDGSLPAPDQVESLVVEVLKRVEGVSGKIPNRTTVLRNVASAIVEAEPTFLRILIAQPEVVSATPSEVSETLLIQPHGKRPA